MKFMLATAAATTCVPCPPSLREKLPPPRKLTVVIYMYTLCALMTRDLSASLLLSTGIQ